MTFLAATAGALLVSLADSVAGPDLAFSIFYLLPVAAAAVGSGRVRSVIVASIAAAAWVVSDIASDAEYSSAVVPLWNAITRFGVLAVVALLIAQLEVAMRHERERSRTDSVTGVGTRRWFIEELANLTATMRNEQLTVWYLDIDDFKNINDTYGHAGGDAVLRQVGQTLQAGLRRNELVARLAGDEFAIASVLARDADPEAAARAVAGRLAQALSTLDPPVTFSAGAVTFVDPPADVDAAIDAADELMYKVKRAGKAGLAHEVVR